MTLLNLLTPDIIAERFYTLPEELQIALEDKDNQREIQIICITNGVGDPEELRSVEAIMAAVILGLTHMDDLGETLVENLSLDKEDAEKIATEVRTKIFEPFRKSIDKIYSPIIPEINKRIVIPPVPAAKMISMPAPVPMPMASVPTSDLKPNPVPKIPTSTTIPGQAWQPTRLTVPGAPTPPAPATPTTSATPTVSPIGTPAKPTTPVVPAPFMMHQESSVAPLAPGADFKLNIPKDIFKSTPAKPVEIPRPPKIAELEIGKAPLPPKPAGATSFRITPPAQSRVVHYADLRTNITTGLAAAKPNEIAVEAPKPIMPKPITSTPIAPAPSIPMVTPAAQTPNAPAMNASPKPPAAPKVVNFGPEEVK